MLSRFRDRELLQLACEDAGNGVLNMDEEPPATSSSSDSGSGGGEGARARLAAEAPTDPGPRHALV